MGANSRRRRAAKQRREGQPTDRTNPFKVDPGYDAPSAYAIVELAVLGTIGRLGSGKVAPGELLARTEALRRRIRPHPAHVLEAVLAQVLERTTRSVLAGGWGLVDLRQLVRRRAGERFLPVLEACLGDVSRQRLDSIGAQAAALRVAALLSRAPRLEAGVLLGSTTDDGDVAAHPKLARVRALLAKAESTEYDEEAEALSAKAQELITKYALRRLLDRGSAPASADLTVRRLWLDPPYVDAKTALVHEVALANRCRSAAAGGFGFCLLLGAPADLDAVEILVTSLLVQADTAMLRHGRRTDGRGTSRTRAFRRSFLFAYAARIGERLRTAAECAAAAVGGDLLPVLFDHQKVVEAAFHEALPHTVEKRSTFSDWDGWAAGVAAADLAQIDVNAKLSERAS